MIDGCAFRVYGHWVKKGEGQNRAALFENIQKTELKHIYVTNLSRWPRSRRGLDKSIILILLDCTAIFYVYYSAATIFYY